MGWVDDNLISVLRQTMLLSDLLGRDSIVDQTRRFDEPVLAPPEALNAFKRKLNLLPEDFAALDDAYRNIAFTVARVESLKVIEQIKEALTRAIAEGTTMRTFIGELDMIADRAGITRLNPFHAQTVFRTNAAQAFMAGRVSIMDGLDTIEFPLWEYHAILDIRVSPTHAALHGTRLPKEEFMARRLVPPLRFNCRCSLSPVHRSEDAMRVDPPTSIEVDGKRTPVEALGGFGQPVSPELLKTLAAEDLPQLLQSTRPTNIAALTDVIRTQQDQVAQTGIRITPVTKLRVTRRRGVNGIFDFDTGHIGLSPDRMILVKDVLGTGDMATQAHADAMSTLVHEIGHSLGVAVNILRYRLDPVYRNLAQAVNDGWARLHFAEQSMRMGMDPRDWGETILRVRDSGYQDMMVRFMDLFEESGFSRPAFRALMDRLNLLTDPSLYEDELRTAIADAVKVQIEELDALPRLGIAFDSPDYWADWRRKVNILRRRAGIDRGEIRKR